MATSSSNQQNSCILLNYMKCNYKKESLCEVSTARRISLVTSSQQRGDTLHRDYNLENTDTSELFIHRTCASTYTSKHHIKRHISNKTIPEPEVKRARRSQTSNFSFKDHCFICGEVCSLEPDPKHPDRWKRVVQCRTADRGPNQLTFKDIILQVCDLRDDDWAHQVRIRLKGALSDLHAADAMYHKNCMDKFRGSRNIESTAVERNLEHDEAFLTLVDIMNNDQSRIWNSVELEDSYRQYSGTSLTRKQLMNELSEHFGKDILILSTRGMANILAFRSKASTFMKLVSTDEEEDCDAATVKVAKLIKQESKELKKPTNNYQTRLSFDEVMSVVSPTLQNLLSLISPKLKDTLPAGMIGNIITNMVTNKSTSLQIALGIVMRDKSIIEQFHDFGVVASYDEILRFKASAARAAAQDKVLTGISNSEQGLVQVVADNFDAQISSQNGLKCTHALAILLTQAPVQHTNEVPVNNTIKRLTKEEMAEEMSQDIPIQRYQGPKKHEMPQSKARRSPLPLKMLVRQSIAARRAMSIDMSFLKDVLSNDKTPEFNGYNTKLAREQGYTIIPATKAAYLPLIDMPPAEPDTILTAMVESQRLTRATGQEHTLFTNDLQLYKVAVGMTWTYPERFQQFIPRLGGMHLLMNFAGAVGTLMADTGLQEILQVAFGGVPKMLAGKTFPQNIRALRLVTEELLRKTIQNSEEDTDLITLLDGIATQSRTSKLWVDNLIKPVLLMMMFTRAEREGDWPLHLYTVRRMIPYFFSAGHFNYARYTVYYLHCMEQLPDSVLQHFLRGHHVMRHQPGLWNGLWSDMYIETTFMRYGHSPGGIIGITLKPSALKKWALSLHICSRLIKDVAEMTENKLQTAVTIHKEESNARIQSDEVDRRKLRDKLATCIDPLQVETHPDGLINIVSGRVCPHSLNVDQSVSIGVQQMEQFHSGWPKSFHQPLTKQVTTMSVTRKQIQVGQSSVYDTKLIFSRVLGLQKARDVDLSSVLKYELAPVPPSMFEDSGDMRITKSKSALKKQLQVEVSERLCLAPDAFILDGCAILWVITWPTSGTVEDFIHNLIEYITRQMGKADTYLVFDRYYHDSIKNATRSARAGSEASRKHQLSITTPLPPQKVTLAATENKVQLINLICDYIQNHPDLLPAHTRLVLTGQKPIPVQYHNGTIQSRNDLQTMHEEADIIIAQQMVHLASQGVSCINVISDDTDVFILLMHFYEQRNLMCNLIMSATSQTRSSTNIRATVEQHRAIVPYLLPAHVLTGCDTVAFCWGIGKGKALKALRSGQQLNHLGKHDAIFSDVLEEATRFYATCYGSKETGDMSAVRYDVWKTKIGNTKLSLAPELRALPPTTEAFKENVLRAHLQCALWRATLDPEPPKLDPTCYGWTREATPGMLLPKTLPPDVSLAPLDVLKMIRCGCSSKTPCSTSRCSCSAARISCSMFCECHASHNCHNEQTRLVSALVEDDD